MDLIYALTDVFEQIKSIQMIDMCLQRVENVKID